MRAEALILAVIIAAVCCSGGIGWTFRRPLSQLVPQSFAAFLARMIDD